MATAAAAVAIVGIGAGAAFAGVSDGNYRPERLHCTGHAEDFAHEDEVEPDCLNLVGSVSDGTGGTDGVGDELAWAGTHQTPEGTFVDQPDGAVDPDGFDPASGLRLYFAADDNLDMGEHDSSAAIGDGPSDGGAIALNLLPSTVDPWVTAVTTGDVTALLHHPLPLVDAGAGACADGICVSLQTTQRVAFAGTSDTAGQQPVADYGGRVWDPETCAGPSDTEEDCGPGGILAWVAQAGVTTVEPGLQVYEDPSPEGSPIGPYPLPALYVGTCGVVLGGGDVQFPAGPLTNGAGQLVIGTGC